MSDIPSGESYAQQYTSTYIVQVYIYIIYKQMNIYVIYIYYIHEL